MFSIGLETIANGHDHNKWYQSRPILGRPSTAMEDSRSGDCVLEEILEDLKKVMQLNLKMQAELESVEPILVSVEACLQMLREGNEKGAGEGVADSKMVVEHHVQQMFDKMPETIVESTMGKTEEVCIIALLEFKSLKDGPKETNLTKLKNEKNGGLCSIFCIDRGNIGEGLEAYPATARPLPEPPWWKLENVAMEVTQILLSAQSVDSIIRKHAEENLKQFQEQNFAAFLLSLSAKLASEEKPVDSRRVASLVLKNALEAKEQHRKYEHAQQWLSLDVATKSQIKACLSQTLSSTVYNARSTASQVIAKVVGIELPQKQWPELIGTHPPNVHQVPSHVKQAYLETLGYICEEVVPEVVRQDQVNKILTTVVQGMNASESNIEVAYECLVSIGSTYYEKLGPYIQDVFNITSKAVQEDNILKLEVAELKSKFCERAQALISGDLHTGSIMVTTYSTQAIDLEFAFYGPMGCDVGAFIGNLILAYLPAIYNNLGLQLLVKQKYREDLFHDTLGFGAAKMMRIVAIAHVEDFELIPFFSENNDDDDEVLLAMAGELGVFIPYVGGVEHAHVLLSPLETLCIVDETCVRYKAVESLCKIGSQMRESDLVDSFITLVKRLAAGEWLTAWVLACGLFHIVYPSASDMLKTELRSIYSQLCQDDMPMVRRVAATDLGKFAATVEAGHLKSDIMSMFEDLTQDSVCLLAVEGCAALRKLLEPKYCVAHILHALVPVLLETLLKQEFVIYDGDEDHPAHQLLLNSANYSSIENQLIFVGLTGLSDPPRKEVPQAIEDCSTAGIRVMVITGDNQATAEANCREIGVFGHHENISSRSLTGEEFMELYNCEKETHLAQSGGLLFSRTEPRLKQERVRLLKDSGEVAATTGDGVNDAPAMKLANIGIAVGIAGTEVAKGASEMVLADDNLSTDVAAVGECRPICKNMKAFMQCADRVMNLFLRVFSCTNATDHEEAMLAIGALAYAAGVNFTKYMPEFYIYLEMSLQNFEGHRICAVTVGAVGNICRALEDKVIPFCDGIMIQLLKNLSSKQLHRKPPIFSCFGDIALAIGESFDKYLIYAMPMLQSVAELSAHTSAFISRVLRTRLNEGGSNVTMLTEKKYMKFSFESQRCR